MPYFGLHYGGTYSVNPLGIRRDSEAPSRGRMDSKTTSAAGLASSRGTRLFGKAAFAVAALGMALGLAVWVTDFDPGPPGSQIPHPRMSPATSRSTSALARARCAVRWSINYPWRTASRPLRSNFDAEFGHIESQLGGQSREEQNVQPEQPAADSRGGDPAATIPAGPRPIFSHRRSIRRRLRRITAPCSQKLADLVPMRSRWRR